MFHPFALRAMFFLVKVIFSKWRVPLLLEARCIRSALKKKVYCQANTTTKRSESTKMSSRSSFAQNLVSNTRPVPSGRHIIAAEAVQDTASLMQAVHCCHGIRSGLPQH